MAEHVFDAGPLVGHFVAEEIRRQERLERAAGEFEQAVALEAYADRLERRGEVPADCEWCDHGVMLPLYECESCGCTDYDEISGVYSCFECGHVQVEPETPER